MAKLCLLLWGFFFFFFGPSAINVRYSLVDNTLTWNFSISFVSSSVTYVYLQIKIQFAQPLRKLAFLFRLAEIIGGKNPVLWRTSNESLCWVQNLHWRYFHSTHTQSNFVIYCNHFSFYRTPLLQVLIEFFELPEDDSIPDDEHFIEIEDTPGIFIANENNFEHPRALTYCNLGLEKPGFSQNCRFSFSRTQRGHQTLWNSEI